jgi:hypothetical protein
MANKKRSLQSRTNDWRQTNIIAGLLQEYNIQTTDDIQKTLKDLLGGTIQEMLETEMGYDNKKLRKGAWWAVHYVPWQAIIKKSVPISYFWANWNTA